MVSHHGFNLYFPNANDIVHLSYTCLPSAYVPFSEVFKSSAHF